MRQYIPPRPGFARRLNSVVLMLSALAIGGVAATSGALPLVPAPAAHAIRDLHGPGVNWGNGVHMKGAGAFIVDGRNVYCSEIWIVLGSSVPDYVSTDTIPAKSVGGVSVEATTGDPLKQIAYIISKYGQTDDDQQAAAVGLSLWEIRGADGRGSPEYQDELRMTRASVGPDVVALSGGFIAEAKEWVSATAAGGLEIQTVREADSPYRGSVTVPAGTTTLTIENGVFDDGSTTRTWGGDGAPGGASLAWEGMPPLAAGWDRYYRVGFSGEYLAISETVLWGDGGGWQSSITSDRAVVRPLRGVSVDLDTAWQPTVSSLVTTRYLSAGEHFSDTITLVPKTGGAASNYWRWRLSATGEREWMPVKAKGTLYGPFLSDPALNPSADAPSGAPIAATMQLVTEMDRDHSSPQSYEIVLPEKVEEQGYYTFKWDIEGDDQDPGIVGADSCAVPDSVKGCRILPTDYFYSDGFGADGETQVGRMRPTFRTDLSSRRIGLAEAFTDDIVIDDMQNWLRGDDGRRLPLTLTGTAYLVPGTELTQSDQVPAGAVPFATSQVTTDPSLNGQTLTSDPLSVPVDVSREFGHVTLRWCLVEADQHIESQGVWEEQCDDFGVPAESAEILWPEVRTEAKPLGTVHDPVFDTAIVNGPVPADTELVFELFRLPIAGDPKSGEDGPTGESWTQTELDALPIESLCIAETRATRTTRIPVVSGLNDGERYVSPEVDVPSEGTYWWVESLVHRSQANGEETVIHRGTCGLPNETTTVAAPTVVTKASPETEVGENAHDTAIVTGPIPAPDTGIRAELTFEVFRSDGNRQTCDDSSLVHRLETPIHIEGPGEYASTEVRFDAEGTYYWIETLAYLHADGTREVVHRGECGLPNEMTRVTSGVLSETGFETSPIILFSSWLLLMSTGVLLVVSGRKSARRRAKS